jgi:hypothetical protein
MTVEEYVRLLRGRLKPKDPRKLERARTGSIVFVLREGDAKTGVTVRIGDRKVEVLDGACPIEGRSTAYVFAALVDWIAFYETGDADRLRALKVFGDVGLLRTMTELSTQQASFVSIRAQPATDRG